MEKTEIQQLLPEIFRQTLSGDTPLDAFVEVMEVLHKPSEEALRQFSNTLNFEQTEDKYIPFLASWLDLEWLFDEEFVQHYQNYCSNSAAFSNEFPKPNVISIFRLRELMTIATKLWQLRGTKVGLLLFLETATGIQNFDVKESVLDESQNHLLFHIEVIAPHLACSDEALIRRIIESQKPVHFTYTLIFK